ncbi:hypothetical protein EYC80_001678 [Monilinia laxa]|uniref:Uncharacterized protein n=1 Tax=Monilinia laxa TaxID=61186 RepID=A0A5N6K5M7_MONLA|nr:hypothetical protein EYC80_001678 [Monilinia laxa]
MLNAQCITRSAYINAFIRLQELKEYIEPRSFVLGGYSSVGIRSFCSGYLLFKADISFRVLVGRESSDST